MPYIHYETKNLKLKKKILWAFQQLVPGKEVPFFRPNPRPSVTTTMATVTPAKMRSLLSPTPIIVNSAYFSSSQQTNIKYLTKIFNEVISHN